VAWFGLVQTALCRPISITHATRAPTGPDGMAAVSVSCVIKVMPLHQIPRAQSLESAFISPLDTAACAAVQAVYHARCR